MLLVVVVARSYINIRFSFSHKWIEMMIIMLYHPMLHGTHTHKIQRIFVLFLWCAVGVNKKQKQHDIIGFVNGTNALLGMALRMRINQVVELMRVRILCFGIRCHFKYVYTSSENVYGVCSYASDGPFSFNVIYWMNFEWQWELHAFDTWTSPFFFTFSNWPNFE